MNIPLRRTTHVEKITYIVALILQGKPCQPTHPPPKQSRLWEKAASLGGIRLNACRPAPGRDTTLQSSTKTPCHHVGELEGRPYKSRISDVSWTLACRPMSTALSPAQHPCPHHFLLYLFALLVSASSPSIQLCRSVLENGLCADAAEQPPINARQCTIAMWCSLACKHSSHRSSHQTFHPQIPC